MNQGVCGGDAPLCQPSSGECVCEANSRRCANSSTAQECNSAGDWISSSCPSDLPNCEGAGFCECLTGDTECVSGDATAVRACTGGKWTESNCSDPLSCAGGQCVCVPGTALCPCAPGASCQNGLACDAELGCAVVCSGDRRLESVEELDSFASEGCQVLSGSLDITGCRDGWQGAQPKNMNGLENLRRIGNNFSICDVRPDTMEGLEALATVGGGFTLEDGGPRSLDGLEGLREIGGTLYLYDLIFKSLEPFRNINKIGGDLRLEVVPVATLAPLLAWPTNAVAGSLSVFESSMPQCDIDQFAAHIGKVCTCSDNGSGSCD